MEKGSEKFINATSPKRNPFNDMLSKVHLTLPTPEPTKRKDRNHVLDFDPYIDRNSSKQLEEQSKAKNQQLKVTRNNKQYPEIVINTPLQTKHSSSTAKQLKSRKQLINQWILQYMQRKCLLGVHWETKFKQRSIELLQQSFRHLKQYSIIHNYTFNNFYNFQQTKKVQIMTDLLKRCQHLRMRDSFHRIVNYYKDEVLFGLSHTTGSAKDNSGLLKLESDCKSHSKAAKQQRQQIKMSEKDISIDSSSNKMMTQKGIESGVPLDDLSALILNYNKLHFGGQPNQSLQNLSKSLKNTYKSITTNKDIGEIQLQTKKTIRSEKKLNQEELPISSRKKIFKSKPDHILIKGDEQNKEEAPFTITYVMNQVDQRSSPSKLTNPTIHDDKSQHPVHINRIYAVESFHQHGNQPPRNVFHHLMQPKEPQQRSTSLQINPNHLRLISPEKLPPQPVHFKGSQPHQYYPQEVYNRQNVNKIKQTLPYPFEKPRAHSATPRIRFTFNSNQLSPQNTTKQNVNKINNNVPEYNHKDCIRKNSLIPRMPSNYKANINDKNCHNNRLPELPIHSRESKTNYEEVRIEQRQPIKDLIIPPAYNEYYITKPHYETQRYIKGPILSETTTSPQPVINTNFKYNQLTSFKDLRQGTGTPIQNQPVYQHFSKPAYVGRAKSPKDKLLVTCSSKNKI